MLTLRNPTNPGQTDLAPRWGMDEAHDELRQGGWKPKPQAREPVPRAEGLEAKKVGPEKVISLGVNQS